MEKGKRSCCYVLLCCSCSLCVCSCSHCDHACLLCLIVFSVLVFVVVLCDCGRTSRSFSFRLLHSAYVYVSVPVSVFIALAFLLLCCVPFCFVLFCFVLFYFSLLLTNPD